MNNEHRPNASSHQYLLAALNGSMLLNGGSAVALLGLVSTNENARNADLTTPLAMFTAGAALAVVSLYLLSFAEGLRHKYKGVPIGAILSMACGGTIGIMMVTFTYACFAVYEILK
jgi:hypothetical protein